jgi:hypothetical protein
MAITTSIEKETVIEMLEAILQYLKNEKTYLINSEFYYQAETCVLGLDENLFNVYADTGIRNFRIKIKAQNEKDSTVDQEAKSYRR